MNVSKKNVEAFEGMKKLIDDYLEASKEEYRAMEPVTDSYAILISQYLEELE